MSSVEKLSNKLQVLPYYVVLGISVSKIFVSIAWYRVVFRQNTIELSWDIFTLRIIWDFVTLVSILLFSLMGMEALWEALCQCFFQIFVQILIYFFCIKRAERKLKELNEIKAR